MIYPCAVLAPTSWTAFYARRERKMMTMNKRHLSWFLGLIVVGLLLLAMEWSYLERQSDEPEKITTTNLKIFIYSFNYDGQYNATLEIWLFNESRLINHPLLNTTFFNVSEPCTLTFRLIPNMYENVEQTIVTNKTSEYVVGDDPLILCGPTANGEGNWFVSWTYIFEEVEQ